MSAQENTTIEADPGLYEQGVLLRFVGCSPDEAAFPCHMRPGDLVIVEPRNGCGMGIDVRRVADGVVDMIWPEEAARVPPPCDGAMAGGVRDPVHPCGEYSPGESDSWSPCEGDGHHLCEGCQYHQQSAERGGKE